jgi:hypothetical protein
LAELSDALEIDVQRFICLISYESTFEVRFVLPSTKSTYFSLSTREGHIPGNILLAQSSSPKISAVAAKANSPALRACTKGSRNDRAKAAVSTLVRD